MFVYQLEEHESWLCKETLDTFVSKLDTLDYQKQDIWE